MKVTSQIEEARTRRAEAIERMEEADARLQAMPEDAEVEEVKFHRDRFDHAAAESRRWEDTIERLQAIHDARSSDIPADGAQPGENVNPAGSLWVTEPLVYSRNNANATSFFRDMFVQKNEPEAAKRIARHMEQMKVEARDLTTGDPGGGGIIPPVYLSELFTDLPRSGRQLADEAPKMALPAGGMSFTIPRLQSGAAVAVQASENSAVQETDADFETLTVNVRTIAGQNDVSRQLFERSQPGIDEIIFRDLLRDYDTKLDTQLLSGAGTSGTHLGIRAVTGKISVTYTDASPTAAELLPKIYDAIQQIDTNRYVRADTIVMHPRRAAWLASNLSSTFPLFQLGQLNQAAGTQDNGFVGNIAGLRVILDANIGSTYGAGTNEDEIYVLSLADLYLMEGPVRSRVFEDVGSATLTVRLQVYGFSAWISARQPKSIAVISGTGLTAPTF